MSLKKLVPSSWSAIGTDVVTVAFENGLDRVASDGLNSQFAKFSEDPAISPAIVLFQFQDQLLDLFCGSRPATLFSERRLLVGLSTAATCFCEPGGSRSQGAPTSTSASA